MMAGKNIERDNYMRLCSVEDCNEKHHGKGFCKRHYHNNVLKKRVKELQCSVEGCDKSVSEGFTKDKLCAMHGSRRKRTGKIEGNGKRNRLFFSLVEELRKSNNPLKYEITNRESWTYIAKCFYGEQCSECGWDEGTCDVHHIEPVSQGGKHSIDNAKVLCPNCHRKIHSRKRKRFSDETIEDIKEIFKSKFKP